jgi:hypothetical protein
MVKPRVFVSYHHANDQAWYDRFSNLFNTRFDVITDKSLERGIDSDDPDYTRRKIREDNITGTSVTIVLCGQETWKRRWVDWEISMTLNKKHGLLGIALPDHTKGDDGGCVVPSRFLENYKSGFAHWMHWNNDPEIVYSAIIEARNRSSSTGLIMNSAPLMQRSRS